MLENSLFLIYSIIPSTQISGLNFASVDPPVDHLIQAAREARSETRGYCKGINSILFVDYSGALFHIPNLQASAYLPNA